MKHIVGIAIVLVAGLSTLSAQSGPKPLFDGRTLQGWEGDTARMWRVEEGAIVGGSLTETVPQNDFLCTTRSYGNFVLRLKFKITIEELR